MPAAPDPLPTLAEQFVTAQLAGDTREALRLVLQVGLHERGHSAEELLLGVIQPAQERVGQLWQENRIGVAEEHLATGIAQLAVSHLYHHLRREAPNGKRVVVACAEGEQHELGARMAANLLEMAGFTVFYLGANVPAESLASMIADRRPDLVVLSATTTLSFPGLRRTIDEVRARVRVATPIFVGGTAFHWVESGAVEGVEFAGRSAAELVTAARRTLGV
jgi:methanogenic corrinoid protein MtbC1